MTRTSLAVLLILAGITMATAAEAPKPDPQAPHVLGTTAAIQAAQVDPQSMTRAKAWAHVRGSLIPFALGVSTASPAMGAGQPVAAAGTSGTTGTVR